MSKQSNLKILLNGIIKENPVLVLILGTCPTINTAELSQGVNLVGIEDKMRGLIDDMDVVSAKLREIFKK